MKSRELTERIEQPVFSHARPVLKTSTISRVAGITVRQLSRVSCLPLLSLKEPVCPGFLGRETCLRPFLQPSIFELLLSFARWSCITIVRWRTWHHLH